MTAFIIKRLLHLIPILLGVSLLTSLLISLTPGDYYTKLQQNPQISPEVLAQLRAKQHLDKPWYVQYAYWLKDALHGDLGYSVAYKIPATNLIMSRLWNTFVLSFSAMVLAWGVAIPLGIWAAVKKDSWADRFCSMIPFGGLSVPDLLLALLALMFAAGPGCLALVGGRRAMEAVTAKDYKLVVDTVVMAAGLLVAGNFVADLLLAWSDPRIRLKE